MAAGLRRPSEEIFKPRVFFLENLSMSICHLDSWRSPGEVSSVFKTFNGITGNFRVESSSLSRVLSGSQRRATFEQRNRRDRQLLMELLIEKLCNLAKSPQR